MRQKELLGMQKHEGTTPQNLILVGLTGSQAYGLNHCGYYDNDGVWIRPSDIDTRGVFVVPTKDVLSLDEPSELIEQKATDTKYDEVKRFLILCLQCNPERLEMLAWFNTDLALNCPQKFCTPEGELILDNQGIFLSKRAIKTYGRYSMHQRKLAEKDPQRKTKPLMHLVRLMITGINLLKHGYVNPDMRKYYDDLMAIRMGKMSYEDALKWHYELNEEFEALKETTKLPDEPDYKKANEILLEVRKKFLEW